MISYFIILRPLNLIIIIICSLLTALINNNLTFNIIFIILAIVLIAGFANIINDIIDFKIDQENQLKRPIASGTISIFSATCYGVLLLIIVFFIMYYFEFNDLTIKLILYFNIPLILLYTPFIKNIPLLGNLVVSAILSMVFITTTTYLQGDLYIILPPATLAFLLMVIREIIKDIADLKGDQKFNINSLFAKFGITIAFKIIVFFSFILLLTVLYFYYTIDSYGNHYLFSFFLFIIAPLFYYLYKFYKNPTSTYCIYLSKVLKLITIFGVIVIYLANT